MKKETAILFIVIAFIVGFIVGGSSGVLYMVNKGSKGSEKTAIVQKPQMAPPVIDPSAPKSTLLPQFH